MWSAIIVVMAAARLTASVQQDFLSASLDVGARQPTYWKDVRIAYRRQFLPYAAFGARVGAHFGGVATVAPTAGVLAMLQWPLSSPETPQMDQRLALFVTPYIDWIQGVSTSYRSMTCSGDVCIRSEYSPHALTLGARVGAQLAFARVGAGVDCLLAGEYSQQDHRCALGFLVQADYLP
jgi:hypothetical protein